MQTWKNKPEQDLVIRLADMTTGFCGSDLQALVSESVLCCLKRQYPNIDNPLIGKINIDTDALKVIIVKYY